MLSNVFCEDSKDMVYILFLAGMAVVGIFLFFAIEAGWLKRPDNPYVTQLIAVIGVPILFALLFVFFGIFVKFYSIIVEEGIEYFLWSVATVAVIGLVALLIGYLYFRYRRRNNSSLLQKLDLDE